MSNLTRTVTLAVAGVLLMVCGVQLVWPQPASGVTADEQRALQEILATEHMLSIEGRGNSDPDGSKWGALITDDFTEFDPYWPYRLEGKKMMVALQVTYDQHNKPPAPAKPATGASPARPLPNIQLYGNVAILTLASVRKGDALTQGGFMQQRKTTQVWVKTGTQWQLAHCNCDWVAGADGVPY